MNGRTGAILLSSLLAIPMAMAQDEVLVVTRSGPDGFGGLFSVRLSDGARALVSDFGDASRGPLGSSPTGLALDAGGQALVADVGSAKLFRVNTQNGARTLVSDFGDPSSGPLGLRPFGVTLEDPHSCLVSDFDAPSTPSFAPGGILFRVNLDTGERVSVSDFNDVSLGAPGNDPAGVSWEGPDQALVIDTFAGTDSRGALFRVDLSTGRRQVISDFGEPSQGPLGGSPLAVAVEATGQILVLDPNWGVAEPGNRAQGPGGLFRVDPLTGERTLLSDFGDPLQGPPGLDPVGLLLENAESALVTDISAGVGSQGSVFRVDLASGARTLVSDFGDGAQGATGDGPVGIALAGPGDSDGDGAPDSLDACPRESGLPENRGCPTSAADGDGDGIPNELDSCPDTFGRLAFDGCAPPRPTASDLVAKSATYYAYPILVGFDYRGAFLQWEVFPVALIENRGSDAAGQFDVLIDVSPSSRTSLLVDGLDAGRSVFVEPDGGVRSRGILLEPGSHTVRIVVDRRNRIAETDEGNNVFVLQFTLPAFGR